MFAKLTGMESNSSSCQESGLGVLVLSTASKNALPAQSEQSQFLPPPASSIWISLLHRLKDPCNFAFLELAAALPCSLENHVHLLTNDRKIESHHLQKLGRESQPHWQTPFSPC